MTYRLVCFIDGDNTPFTVMISIDSYIDVLKQKIKEVCSPYLEKVDSKDLILWKIDVDLSDQAIEECIEAGQYQPLPFPPKPLRAQNKICHVWPGPPPEGHLHLFISLPAGFSPVVAQTSDATTRDLWPAVTLNTVSQRKFERLETVELNKIFKLDDDEPEFLIGFRIKLADRRWIKSGRGEHTLSSLLRDKHPNFDGYFGPIPINVEQRDRVSDECLLLHLASALINHAWKEDTIKEANVRWIFDTLGMYFGFILGSREDHEFCHDWPFKIIVNVKAEQNKRYRYTPRSDFRISVDGLMYLLVEVQSDIDQYDRYRMLLQAACAARLGRLFYHNPFIVVALYIENSGRVKRYFVFQGDGTDPTVSYVEDSQDWYQPFQLFNAIFEIYNLASIIQKDRPKLEHTEERIRSLASDISRNFLNPLNTGLQCDKDVYQDRQVVDSFTRAGFTLESNDEDEKGWAPLDQLNPTMRYAKQSDGTPVVVKLLYPGSNELRILRHLDSIKSRIKPTLPLIETIKSNVRTFIILPEATPLDLRFKFGNFGSQVSDMSLQLIEGVAFLHRHGIAHLDIKPQNIVVLRNRLFIIDFDISVCVDGPDALIDRWCGTPSWMAPEIGHQDGPKCLYSPIRADLWSCGQVLRYLADEGALKENPFEALTRRLLNKDPRLRPLLHLLSSDTVGYSLSEPQVGFKRKADTVPPYAKRLAISTVHICQSN